MYLQYKDGWCAFALFPGEAEWDGIGGTSGGKMQKITTAELLKGVFISVFIFMALFIHIAY